MAFNSTSASLPSSTIAALITDDDSLRPGLDPITQAIAQAQEQLHHAMEAQWEEDLWWWMERNWEEQMLDRRFDSWVTG